VFDHLIITNINIYCIFSFIFNKQNYVVCKKINMNNMNNPSKKLDLFFKLLPKTKQKPNNFDKNFIINGRK